MSLTSARGPNLGLVEGAVLKLITRPTTVVQSDLIGERFRMLTLSGESLRGVDWVPGQKVQLMLGGWVQRTYTPLSFDNVAGSMQLLAYAHGEGPGRDWSRGVQVGDAVVVFGPRSSVDLNWLRAPGLLFGDETSLGLAHALRFSKSGGEGIELLLEVDDVALTLGVMQRLNISNARLIERRANDAHMPELEQAASSLIRKHKLEFGVLSGKSTSIQQLGKYLRVEGLRKLQTRAYWAPGKKGLD